MIHQLLCGFPTNEETYWDREVFSDMDEGGTSEREIE